MKYDIKNEMLSTKRVVWISIFEAAIDWGNEKEEAEYPEKIPYYCELSAQWNCKNGGLINVSTHGLIYAKANIHNPKIFAQWDLSRFEIDHIANSDEYDLEDKQDNEQGFEFTSLYAYENYAEISQAAADELEYIANNLADFTAYVEYPNGILNLVGFEK